MVSIKRAYCILTIACILISATTIHSAQVLFTPTLAVSEEYTDNLFLTPDDETEDYITTAGLGLTGEVLWRTAGLELNYTPTYHKFSDNSDLDYWRHAATLYTWKVIKRNTRLELRNTYIRTNDPQDESDAIDPDDPLAGQAIEADINRRGRNEYYTNNADVRLTHQFGSNDSFYLGYNYSLLRDVDIIVGQEPDDNDIRTTSAGIDFSMTSKWTVELDAFHRDSNYEDETESDRVQYDGSVRVLYNFGRTLSGFVDYRHTVEDFDDEASEDYNIYQPTIGFEKRFQDSARISIGVGYYVQDFDTSDDRDSFIANTEIYKRWDSRVSHFDIIAMSGYEIDDAGVDDNGLRVYYEGGIEFGYRFSPRFSSTIHASYRNDDYPNAVPDREDRTIRAGAGLDWQFLQWMAAGLDYNYTNLASDLAEREYSENSVVLTITMTPSSPFRLN